MLKYKKLSNFLNIESLITLLFLLVVIGFAYGLSISLVGDVTASSPYLPTKDASSEYMIGNVSAGVFFIESNASNAPDENTEDWNETEVQTVKQEIRDSFRWWEMRAAENHTFVNFSWEWNEVNVSLEPIKHKSSTSQTDKDMWKWIDEATDSMGFTASGYQGVRDYINELRFRMGTHWTFAVFVVDSSNDEDDAFADDDFAFAYLGGPFYVMTYGNKNYGIENMDAVSAHEIGHIFFGLDEYAEAKEPKDKRTGYLNVTNSNSEYEDDEPENLEESIMRGGIIPYINGNVSLHAKGAIGWWDRDGDNISDILDTHPETRVNDTEELYYTTEVEINGSAEIQPLENKNPLPQTSGRNISLNTIHGIEYSVDGGDWTLVTDAATDGAFDEQIEWYSFKIYLTNGSHEVRVRAMNNVRNVDLTPAKTNVTVDLRLAPKIQILAPTAGSNQTKEVFISWNVSDFDGTIQTINLYYVSLYDDSRAEELEIIVEGLPNTTLSYDWKTYTEFELEDGPYRIVVTAIDNSNMTGLNSTDFFLNNPDTPNLLVQEPPDGKQQGEILLNWFFRDNDVGESEVNDSFLFDIYLDVFDYGSGENKTDYEILIYEDLRPDDPLMNTSLGYMNWSGDDDDDDFAFHNWTLNVSMLLESLAFDVVDSGELPEGFLYDEENMTFKAPDASYQIRVRVTELSDESFSVSESSETFLLDNPDPPVLMLNLSGKLGREDFYAVREEILFSAKESYDPDENNTALNYSWDFGDGETVNGSFWKEVWHSYPVAGNYTASLMVTDDTGLNTTTTFTLTIHLDYPFNLTINFTNARQREDGWVWEDEVVPVKNGVSDENFDSPDYLYTWYLYPHDAERTPENLLSTEDKEEFSFSLNDSGLYAIVLQGFDSANEGSLFAETNTSIEIRNQGPVARTVDYVRVNPNETITFDGSLSTDTPSDMTNLDYAWYVDNVTDEGRKIGTGQNIEHAFTESGDFRVFLKVTDDDGNFSIASIRLKVNEYAIAPIIEVTKNTVSAGEELQLAVTLFTETPGSGFDENEFVKGLSFHWDFDDDSMGSGRQLDHVFSSDGTYKVTLHVLDNDSLDDPYHAEITIQVREKPQAYFVMTFSGDSGDLAVNQKISFDARGSNGGGGDIVKYLWNFGDGTVEHYYDGDDLSGNYGERTGSLADGKKVTHSYTKKGIYTAKLTVYNEHGGSGVYKEALLVDEETNQSDSFIDSILEDPSLENEDFRRALAIVIAIVVVLLVIRRGKKKRAK